jgi:hypothetical protein
MIKCLSKNKEWIFGGIGVFIITAVSKLFSYLLKEELVDVSTAKGTVIVTSSIAIIFIAYAVYGLFDRKHFFSFSKQKLRELATLFLDDEKTNVPKKYKYNCFESYRLYKSKIETINAFICENQGALLEFVYNTSELHKPLKAEVSKEKPDLERIKQSKDRVQDFIIRNMKRAYSSTSDLILRYFDGRPGDEPRICVKLFGSGLVYEDYRRPIEDYTYIRRTKDYDTGCHEVIQNGYAFIDNNIPLHIKEENYKNPRINTLEVVRDLAGKKDFKDPDDWAKYWRDIHLRESETVVRPPRQSCYKSTLIIPMTLLRNNISTNVREHFGIPRLEENDNGRAIYGLLCFDHTQINYFNEETDIPMGYVFADILSLHLIFGEMYTKYSKSFIKGDELIAQREAIS